VHIEKIFSSVFLLDMTLLSTFKRFRLIYHWVPAFLPVACGQRVVLLCLCAASSVVIYWRFSQLAATLCPHKRGHLIKRASQPSGAAPADLAGR